MQVSMETLITYYLWSCFRFFRGKILYFRAKKKKRNRQKWSILLLDVILHEQNFVLVNLHNANTEKDQLNTIDELKEMLKSVNNISAKQTIIGADFNLYFDSLLESQDKNLILKKTYCQNDWG